MASDQVRVFGMTMTLDLPLDKHISNVCATCFYWLRQLRRVRPSDVHSMRSMWLRWSTSTRYTTVGYMKDCCIHNSDIARRHQLRSVGCRQLLVPRHHRSMFGRRAFSVAGSAAWNSSPDYLRYPTRSVDSFCRDLKTVISFY